MSLPRPVSDTLIELLKPVASELGERLGASAVNERYAEIEPSGSSALNQQIKKDPRWIKAQMKYLQRQQAREQELIALAGAEERVKEERPNRFKEQKVRNKRSFAGVGPALTRTFH